MLLTHFSPSSPSSSSSSSSSSSPSIDITGWLDQRHVRQHFRPQGRVSGNKQSAFQTQTCFFPPPFNLEVTKIEEEEKKKRTSRHDATRRDATRIACCLISSGGYDSKLFNCHTSLRGECLEFMVNSCSLYFV